MFVGMSKCRKLTSKPFDFVPSSITSLYLLAFFQVKLNTLPKTIWRFEQKKRKLQQDKTIQRTKLVLNSTPLGENNDFLAASINTSSTTFEFVDNSPNKSIFSAMIFGLIIGIFYVLLKVPLTEDFDKE